MEESFQFSIAHEFDAQDNWVGYEYIERVSENHLRILRYDASGCLKSTRHLFQGAPTSGSVDEFIDYMRATKAIAINDNITWREEERKSRPLDLSTSLSGLRR
jgi:hypothetical protein